MKQILLIDDDAVQLRMRKAILCQSGFAVATATNAEAALALLRASPNLFGLVISDHFLQCMTAVEVIRRLRTFLPQLPVAVISGMPGLEDEYEGLNVEVHLKPMPPQDLIELVRSRIGAQP